jgi:hypothetical protein
MAESVSLDASASCACARDTSSIHSTAFLPRSLNSLLLDAQDRCDDLRVIQHAYNALEKLISPEFNKPRAEVQPNRSELAALLALLNAETERRIETAIQTVAVARQGEDA